MPRACGMRLCASSVKPNRPRPKVRQARRKVETTRWVSSRGSVCAPSPSMFTCASVSAGSSLSVKVSSSW